MEWKILSWKIYIFFLFGLPFVQITTLAPITFSTVFQAFFCLDYIFDNDPITNRFVSAPNGQNVATFIAGILQGMLDAAEFVRHIFAFFLT